MLALDPDDSAPVYVQLERRVRLAVASGALVPGDRLPSVRAVARRLGISPNTVGRAYAELHREGVIAARAGGGSEVASRERLDQPGLARQRAERLRTLARQVVVRGLALGLEPAEIVYAVTSELAARGRAVRAEEGVPALPLGADESPLLSARNRLRGTVQSIRVGDVVAEVTIQLPGEAGMLVVAITRASVERLGLQVGAPVSAYIKATEPVLGP